MVHHAHLLPPSAFDAIARGDKRHGLGWGAPYEPGDTLHFMCQRGTEDPLDGRQIYAKVTYVTRASDEPNLPDNLYVFSFAVMASSDRHPATLTKEA